MIYHILYEYDLLPLFSVLLVSEMGEVSERMLELKNQMLNIDIRYVCTMLLSFVIADSPSYWLNNYARLFRWQKRIELIKSEQHNELEASREGHMRLGTAMSEDLHNKEVLMTEVLKSDRRKLEHEFVLKTEKIKAEADVC